MAEPYLIGFVLVSALIFILVLYLLPGAYLLNNILNIRFIMGLLFFLFFMAVKNKELEIFIPVDVVLNLTTEGPPMFQGHYELPGTLKFDPNGTRIRITRGRLPFSYFMFDYEVELEEIPMEFNLSRRHPDDESFSSAVYSCLMSPQGLEYQGPMYYTKSRHICTNWKNPLVYTKSMMKPFLSKDFPDFSIENAHTYCRNPDGSRVPWCFRKDNKKREDCAIGYCQRKNCTLTGPGIEYLGFINVSTYGDCEPWSFDVPFENISSAQAFHVKNFCRNPSFDPSGPYCFVHENYHDDGEYPWLKKAYCDIPLCDVYYGAGVYNGELHYRKLGPHLFCVVGREVNYYTHYTLFHSEVNSLNISMKLWNPATAFNDQIRIALSVIAIPANGSEFLRWDIGFEIVLSNNRTGVIVNPPEDSVFVQIPGLLSGIRWTNINLEWDDNGLYLNVTRNKEKIPIYKFKEPNLPDTIRGLFHNRLQYVSVLGSPALMRIMVPNEGCEEQITTEEIYARFYPLFREGPVRRLPFSVKSSLACFVIMRVSPLNNSSPEVIVSVNGRSKSQLILRTYENITQAGREMVEVILQEADTVGDVTLFNWTYFSISIRDNTLRFSIHSPIGSRYLFDIKNKHFNTLKYYAISSVSIAHWTLGCPGARIDTKPYLPFGNKRLECSKTINDIGYKGQLSVTEKGRVCLPWISDFVKPIEKMYVDHQTYRAVNYCRNVDEDDSAYCYVYNRLANKVVERDYCLIPKCITKVCRDFGTGVGNKLNLTTTFSGRMCKLWLFSDVKFQEMFHVDENASVYKKQLLDINLSENFCRNPNNDLSGPWCSTIDPKVETDLCDIPDCDRPFETIKLVTRNIKHETYIKPLWRVSGWKFWVKRWERNITAGFILTLLSANRSEYFRLIFDDTGPDKVILAYCETGADPIVVKRYAPYDFYLFIPNNWTGYHLTLRQERLILGLIGEKIPFLEWEYSFLFEKFIEKGPPRNFTPQFLTYEKTNDGVLAMSFEPEDAFVDILTSDEQDTYYSITFMKKENTYLPANLISFNFVGKGNVKIIFYNAIAMGPVMILDVGDGEFHDRFLSTMYVNGKEIPLEIKRTNGPTIHETKWTEIKMIMTEEQVTILRNDVQFSIWSNPKPLIVYYFKVKTRGNITWITNSKPPEMNAKPIDGGWADWSSWDCSVSCGGGRGNRERFCTSPPPSLFGMPCLGEPKEFGLCNTFECGDLPPEILEVISFRMKRYLYHKTVYQTTNSVKIDCYPDILELIKERTPDYLYYWDRNGVPITEKKPIKDMYSYSYSYDKSIAEVNDSGVYSCAIETPLVIYRPVKVTSLIVKTNSVYTDTVFRGQPYVFHSNNVILAWLYRDLQLVWLHDGIPSDKYNEIYLPLMNKKTVMLEMEDAGVWECTVHHKEFKRKWHTNWVNIKVRYRSDFVKYLMDDNPYTKHVFYNFEPIYVKISFVIMVIVAVIMSIGVAILLLYIQRMLIRLVYALLRKLEELLSEEYTFQEARSSSSDSDSSEFRDAMIPRYSSRIKKKLEPILFYITDEFVSVSDSSDHVGFKRLVQKRRIIRYVIPPFARKKPKDVQRKKHKRYIKCEPPNYVKLPYTRLMISYEEEAKRERNYDRSSSSSDSYCESNSFIKYPMTNDLHYQEVKEYSGDTTSTEITSSDIDKESDRSRDFNTDETNSENKQSLNAEDEQSLSSEDEQSLNSEYEQSLNSEYEQSLNPQYEQSLNPEYEQSLNSEYEQSLNPQYEQSLNSEYEQSLNPQYEQSLNSEYEQSLNPQYEQSLNPEYEQSLNPEDEQSVSSDTKEYIGQSTLFSASSSQTKLSPEPEKRKLYLRNLSDREIIISEYSSSSISYVVDMDQLVNTSSDTE